MVWALRSDQNIRPLNMPAIRATPPPTRTVRMGLTPLNLQRLERASGRPVRVI
jgi:hypothetical protein